MLHDHPVPPPTHSQLPRDRAFRALVAESPETVPHLLAMLGLLPDGARLAPHAQLPTGLDPPTPRLDVDWVGRLVDGQVLHLEWQGYPDSAFRDRLLRYHLLLAVKYAPSPVRTIVLWSRAPSRGERSPLTTGQLVGHVDHVILAEQDADIFLADPATACFAMACASDDPVKLALRVVAALEGAPPRAAVVAALAAAALGSYVYGAFQQEWERRGMEPIIIEELARMLEDRGEARGEARGRLEGARVAVIDLCEALNVPLDDARRGFLASATLEEADTLRAALKRERAWPAG